MRGPRHFWTLVSPIQSLRRSPIRSFMCSKIGSRGGYHRWSALPRAALTWIFCGASFEPRETWRQLYVVDVLEQADIVRGKLGTWLRESPHGTVVTLCGELFRQASILCDSESREILSPQDLDCHCMMEELNFSKPRFDKLSALLPFSMSEDAQRMVVKASASGLSHRTPRNSPRF